MNLALAGRVALVTGAGRGIGKAAALALAAAGADVILVARTESQLDETREAAGALGRSSWVLVEDMADPQSPERISSSVLELTGGADIVVHAAGTQIRKSALDLKRVEWDQVQGTNVAAPFFLSCRLTETPSERVCRRHIFIASLASSIGLSNMAAYGASKSAVVGVARSLAVEWAQLGITVNAVQPGYIRTELTEAVFVDPVRRAWVESRIPMGHTGTPEDISGAIVFLASDGASYVTGQMIAVDGGWLAS